MPVCLLRGSGRTLLLVATVGLCSVAAARDQSPSASAEPLSPGESVASIRVPAGLRVELVAAEPDVIDPVAMAFDERGRLFVAEMRDYPNEPARGQPPRSCIRLLEDKDGDGRYETSSYFAEGLPFCNGVLPWRGGVIATLAGEIGYFPDDNGDGKADRHEPWFTGFKAENSQLRANHPTLGLDGHVYVANGLRGGDVIAVREGWARPDAKPLSISGLDFRFDPRTGECDAVTGHGQFGLCFDDFGHRFVCSNRNPCMQVMLENRYIKRNPLLALPRVVHDVSPAGEQSHLYPLSQGWTTSNMHAHQFTAACGVTIYRGDLLPSEFYGNSFTCDPTGNLIHRDVLESHGVQFDAVPNASQTEFFASKDEWLRPVNLAHGPDGALCVVAMYRPVIEHPDFMPPELKQRPENFQSGQRGRIYRIVPAGYPAQAPGRDFRPNLALATTAELVALLGKQSPWWRDMAARLILERADQQAIEPLRKMAANAQLPQGRVQALWLLQALGKLEPADALAAMSDADPRVQSQGVRLAEPWLDSNRELRRRVLALAAADAPRLRSQVALSLGQIEPQAEPATKPQRADDRELAVALSAIAIRDADDRWTRAAVATSVSGRLGMVLDLVLLEANKRQQSPGMLELVGELSQMLGSQQDAVQIGWALEGAVEESLTEQQQPAPDKARSAQQLDLALAAIRGAGLGLARRGKSLVAVKAELESRAAGYIKPIHWYQAFARAAALAADPDADVARRNDAVKTLAFADFAAAGKPLLALAADKRNPELRSAAIEALARFDDPSIAPILLEDFGKDTPAMRRTIVAAMLAVPSRALILLDEMSAGRISATELSPDEWRRLAAHKDPQVKAKAKELQAAATPADRQQVINDYRPALELTGEPARGKEVFAKNCAACHHVAGQGVNLGPNISDSLGKTPEYYLLNILDPNKAVDNRFFSFTLTLTDGRVLTGIIDTETASSVTVKQQDNKTTTVLREDIDEMRSNGISFMPVGFEKNINPQQMADLIAFLKNWRYLE